MCLRLSKWRYAQMHIKKIIMQDSAERTTQIGRRAVEWPNVSCYMLNMCATWIMATKVELGFKLVFYSSSVIIWNLASCHMLEWKLDSACSGSASFINNWAQGGERVNSRPVCVFIQVWQIPIQFSYSHSILWTVSTGHGNLCCVASCTCVYSITTGVFFFVLYYKGKKINKFESKKYFLLSL